MVLRSLLLLHVFTATVAMLSGFMAMTFRKGSGWHGAAGSVFFVSLLTASGAGACIALFLRPNAGNVMGSTLTFYLVATAWIAAKRREGKPRIFDLGALLFGLAVAIAGATWGIVAVNSPTGSKDGYDPPMFFIFGTIALLFVVSDIRMVARGGFGSKRISRHLLRMSLALLLATFSFYPGQAKLFPLWLRETRLLMVPHILIIGSMLFHLVRVRAARKRASQTNPSEALQWTA